MRKELVPCQLVVLANEALVAERHFMKKLMRIVWPTMSRQRVMTDLRNEHLGLLIPRRAAKKSHAAC